jgi:hypothetical protein
VFNSICQNKVCRTAKISCERGKAAQLTAARVTRRPRPFACKLYNGTNDAVTLLFMDYALRKADSDTKTMRMPKKL